MALVKTCPTCGYANPPTTPFCSVCGVSLVSVAPSDLVQAALSAVDAAKESVGKVVCPDCSAENAGGSYRCVYCDYALNALSDEPCCAHVELTWPWGKQKLTGPLRIGRNPPADECLIKAITDLGYDNISRSHADLLPDAATGGVSIMDLGSSNGTFVDGVRIPVNKPVSLKNGAVIRFASNLSVTVTLDQPKLGE